MTEWEKGFKLGVSLGDTPNLSEIRLRRVKYLRREIRALRV
jgi:hypothetical protein